MNVHPAVSALVEAQFAAARIVQQAGLSRCCAQPLQGSGGTRWCGACGGTIPAADINHEVPAPVRGAS